MRTVILFFLLLYCIQTNAQDFKALFKSENLESGCYRIPAIVSAVNGDILVATDERVGSCADLRTHRNINIVMRRSHDNGSTWLPIERVVEFPEGLSASDPSFIVDGESGDIFLFYNYMDLDVEPNIYYFHMIKSSDNGETWSGAIDITSQIAPSEWHEDFKFITSGRGIQTRNGELLHTLVHLDKGVFVFGSADHGESWNLKSEALYPGDESKIIQLVNGHWMVNSRVNKAGHRYIHRSEDDGETWITTPDTTLIDPSCNAALLQHSNGNLYFSNLDDDRDRQNLILRKSNNNGFSWIMENTIYHGPAAYSSMDVLTNGDLGIVFEKDNYEEITFYKYKIKED